jgi:hypothetical protein
MCRFLMDATIPALAAATVAPTVEADDRCPACGLGRLHWHEFSFAPEPEVIDSS